MYTCQQQTKNSHTTSTLTSVEKQTEVRHLSTAGISTGIQDTGNTHIHPSWRNNSKHKLICHYKQTKTITQFVDLCIACLTMLMATAGFIPLGYSGQGMQLPNHLKLVLRFKMTGAVSPAFMAGTGATSSFLHDNVGISGCTVPKSLNGQ